MFDCLTPAKLNRSRKSRLNLTMLSFLKTSFLGRGDWIQNLRPRPRSAPRFDRSGWDAVVEVDTEEGGGELEECIKWGGGLTVEFGWTVGSRRSWKVCVLL